MAYHVYVSLTGEGRLARFSMHEESGDLTPEKDIPLPGQPAYTAFDPTNRFMYVVRKENYRITTFGIYPESGDLTALGTTPVDANPTFIAADKTGRFMLMASYYDGKTAVYPIGADGLVHRKPIELLDTGFGAHCILADPSNRFVFVPHVASNDGPNAIFQFLFDEHSGKLIPNDPPRVQQEAQTGPRHLCFHPVKNIVYVSNEQGSSITVYDLDRSKGTLSVLQRVSNLPDGWTGENTCSQIRTTPDGRFLYAPNRGHDSLAEYAIDPDSGLLNPLGHAPAEQTPRAFQIDPKGRFLLSVGRWSGVLRVYRIHNKTGRLEQIAAHSVGESMWITILPFSV